MSNEVMFREVVLHKNPIPMYPHKRPRRTKSRDLKEVNRNLWQVITEACAGQLKWPLFIHGSTGTGKTSASLCLVDRVERAKFFAMPELADEVADLKAGRSWTKKDWWDQFAAYALVVVDDVGLREVSDDFQMETLWYALEKREGMPFVCTSNLNPKGIAEHYGDRVHSRLCSGKIFELKGRDRRIDDGED